MHKGMSYKDKIGGMEIRIWDCRITQWEELEIKIQDEVTLGRQDPWLPKKGR